jgi:hypothetical protein
VLLSLVPRSEASASSVVPPPPLNDELEANQGPRHGFTKRRDLRQKEGPQRELLCVPNERAPLLRR